MGSLFNRNRMEREDLLNLAKIYETITSPSGDFEIIKVIINGLDSDDFREFRSILFKDMKIDTKNDAGKYFKLFIR